MNKQEVVTLPNVGDLLKTTKAWYADADWPQPRRPVNIDDVLLVVSVAYVPEKYKHDHVIMTLLHPVYGPIDWKIQWQVWISFFEICVK